MRLRRAVRHRLETTSLPSSHGYSERENKTPIACEHCINRLVSVKKLVMRSACGTLWRPRLDFYLSWACWFCQTSSPPLCQQRSVYVMRYPHNERKASFLSSVSRALCGPEHARVTRCARNALALAEPNHACDKAATHRRVRSVRPEAALTVRGRRIDASRKRHTPHPKRECTASAALP